MDMAIIHQRMEVAEEGVQAHLVLAVAHLFLEALIPGLALDHLHQLAVRDCSEMSSNLTLANLRTRASQHREMPILLMVLSKSVPLMKLIPSIPLMLLIQSIPLYQLILRSWRKLLTYLILHI